MERASLVISYHVLHSEERFGELGGQQFEDVGANSYGVSFGISAFVGR